VRKRLLHTILDIMRNFWLHTRYNGKFFGFILDIMEFFSRPLPKKILDPPLEGRSNKVVRGLKNTVNTEQDLVQPEGDGVSTIIWESVVFARYDTA